MSRNLPSAALVAWGNAWLIGETGLDEAVDAVECGVPHVLGPSPDRTGSDPHESPLRGGLARLRSQGLTQLRLALPAPGDPLGLSGPPSFNTAALDAGQAVVALLDGGRIGLVPVEDRRGSSYVGVRWERHPAAPPAGAADGWPDVPALAEADRGLSLALRDATSVLSETGRGDQWGPELAGALGALRAEHRQGDPGLAPGYPGRAHRLAALAGRLGSVVALARDRQAGLTGRQTAERTRALAALDQAIRRALVAAHNSVWAG
ncbi:hypothetical protein [Allonocardiopsis opalescens]|uniref:Uncharacterized protein n=1 Tax=Allonocardiopsis opalescens TaxID=1144618 RepID=A0A2T0Q6J0_9ACTN|nr:hypothetical protein [Allonocardiopsis opalescens]PRX99459.1 hypothetical protein CLV72_10355 [Allonocardiopsis opalescens]